MDLTPLQQEIALYIDQYPHSAIKDVVQAFSDRSESELRRAIYFLVEDNVLRFDLQWKLIPNEHPSAATHAA